VKEGLFTILTAGDSDQNPSPLSQRHAKGAVVTERLLLGLSADSFLFWESEYKQGTLEHSLVSEE
jgi:hypothetical protein